jgi:hypothetical protein
MSRASAISNLFFHFNLWEKFAKILRFLIFVPQIANDRSIFLCHFDDAGGEISPLKTDFSSSCLRFEMTAIFSLSSSHYAQQNWVNTRNDNNKPFYFISDTTTSAKLKSLITNK